MESIKLQKYFSDCGVASRRAAEEIIKNRLVKVNGEVAELGQRIDPDRDIVEYKGKKICRPNTERHYILLNKPRGFVTTLSDEKGRATVRDLVSDVGARVYPVGRLDMDSDGLLLLTDDGELANRLTHPKHEIPKIYHVTVAGEVSDKTVDALSRPMDIDGYQILPVEIKRLSYSKDQGTTLRFTLYEGRNRQIRKMCDTVGIKITRLCRVAIGKIELGSLEIGRWRNLNAEEISYLKGEEN